MGAHSVTCHPTQVNALRFIPLQPDRPVVDLFTLEGWKAELALVLVRLTCSYLSTYSHPSK